MLQLLSMISEWAAQGLGALSSFMVPCLQPPSTGVTPSSLATSTPPSASSQLTEGALVGLIIGCVLLFLLLLSAPTLMFIRHSAVHKGRTGGLYSLFVPKPKPKPFPPSPPVGYWGPNVWMLNDPERLRKMEYLEPQPGQVYEVTGNHGYEAAGGERFPAREIDGVMLAGELPLTTRMPEMAAVGTPVEQVDRGRTRWRKDNGTLDRVISQGRGRHEG